MDLIKQFAPLLESGWLIIVHALAAMLAIALGGAQLALKKGSTVHRYMGRVWVTLMVVVAISSFGIHHIRMLGPFSIIHLLSAYTLYTLWKSVVAARSGRIKDHRRDMLQLYALALIVTGLFTFLPGRIMHQVLFG